MYGKKRIGINRKNEIFVAGEGSHQFVGKIAPAAPMPGNPFGKGFAVCYWGGEYIETAQTKTQCKIVMFNALKNHVDCVSVDGWQINEKGQLTNENKA